MSLREHYRLVGLNMVLELCLSENITVWLGKIWCWSYVTQRTLQAGWVKYGAGAMSLREHYSLVG